MGLAEAKDREALLATLVKDVGTRGYATAATWASVICCARSPTRGAPMSSTG